MIQNDDGRYPSAVKIMKHCIFYFSIFVVSYIHNNLHNIATYITLNKHSRSKWEVEVWSKIPVGSLNCVALYLWFSITIASYVAPYKHSIEIEVKSWWKIFNRSSNGIVKVYHIFHCTSHHADIVTECEVQGLWKSIWSSKFIVLYTATWIASYISLYFQNFKKDKEGIHSLHHLNGTENLFPYINNLGLISKFPVNF